jgi:hypothetical protein
MNNKKATIIEDEQEERRGATTISIFDKMKKKRNCNKYQ